MITQNNAKHTHGPYGRNGLVIRLAYLALAVAWSVTALITRNRWIVLCYHSVRFEQRQRFERQINYLAGQAVSVRDIGQGQPGVCLTFDDAFACLLENALPIARRHSVPLAIFPVTANLDQLPQWDMPSDHPERHLKTMSQQQLEAISKDPLVMIGSHTATHPRLAEMPADVVTEELIKSREALNRLLQMAPMDLALPHGSYDKFVCQCARKVGYHRIFTLDPIAVSRLPSSGVIGRYQVDPDMWMIEFRLTVNGCYGYLFVLRRFINWYRSWNRQNRSVGGRGAFHEAV